MKNERKFIVYKHTSPDGKSYIGMTGRTLKQRSGNNGYRYRGTKFYEAIQLYGWDNIKHEVLEENLTLDEARERERYYIKEFNTQNPDFGYNTSAGGDYCPEGWHQTEEFKQKMSELHTGANAPWFGKPLSDAHKQKMSNTTKGRQLTEEHKQHISEGRKGMKFTEEHKQHISEVQKGCHYYNNGTIEVRAFECPEGFIPGSLSRGKHWYNNGDTELQAFECPDGFIKGRLKRA